MSLLVPIIADSMVDLPVSVEAEVTTEQVNQAFETALCAAPLKGTIRYETDPIVSTDIIHESASSIFDSALTKVIPNPKGCTVVKVFSWHDNECMYSCRCADILIKLNKF